MNGGQYILRQGGSETGFLTVHLLHLTWKNTSHLNTVPTE
jgi:hypothetical protein